MIDQYTFDAAAYVLGALSPEESRAFEEHMSDCAACTAEVREFSELPGLLAQLPPDDPALTITEEQLEPPPVLPSLLLSVRRERRRRRWRAVTAAGLAAACVAGLGTAVALDLRSTAPVQTSVPLAFRPVGDVPVEATATLQPKEWGTEVRIACTYTGGGWAGDKPRTYRLVPLDRNGKEHAPIGDWEVLPNKEVLMTGATALTMDQLGRLEIRSSEGRPILQLRL
jgi:Putative zinc-finger